MSNSGLNDYQEELLTILMEECGEVVQEICKIQRFGLFEESHHIIGKSHLECLEQELGDILACIDLLKDATIGISDEGLELAKQLKHKKVGKWMKHKKPSDKAHKEE